MGPARAHSKAKRAGNHSAVGRSLAACAATLAKTSLEPMNALEWRATTALSLLQALRMLGMFMILPVFELYARDLPGHVTPLQIGLARSEEHTSELQSLMRISYAVFCLKKKKHKHNT